MIGFLNSEIIISEHETSSQIIFACPFGALYSSRYSLSFTFFHF